MYTFLYNKSLNFVRITRGKESIVIGGESLTLVAGPKMAAFLQELVEQANKENSNEETKRVLE